MLTLTRTGLASRSSVRLLSTTATHETVAEEGFAKSKLDKNAVSQRRRQEGVVRKKRGGAAFLHIVLFGREEHGPKKGDHVYGTAHKQGCSAG
jgi:hypothetical protein